MDAQANEITALLTTEEAAAILKMSRRTLEYWREQGYGLPFLKVGRAVRYERQTIVDYLAGRHCRNTAEARAAVRSDTLSNKDNPALVKRLRR